MFPLRDKEHSHSNPASNLLLPLGSPVWPQAIQRSTASGVRTIFFFYEQRFACASL
jgi:hypothetical protein